MWGANQPIGFLYLWCAWDHKPIKASLCRLLWRLEALAFTADWFLWTYPSTYTRQLRVSRWQTHKKEKKTAKGDILNEKDKGVLVFDTQARLACDNLYTSQLMRKQVNLSPSALRNKGLVVIPEGRHDNGVSWHPSAICMGFFFSFSFLVSRETFGSKCYVSPSFWRWSAPFPSWSLWVAEYENHPAHPDFMRYSPILSLLNKRRISLPGSAGVWKKKVPWPAAQLTKTSYLLDRWFCLPSETSSSLYFSIAGWPSTLWKTWSWVKDLLILFFLKKKIFHPDFSSRIFWGIVLCSLSLFAISVSSFLAL